MSSASPYEPPRARLEGVDADAPVHAGFWRRWAALVLDTLILYIVVIVLAFAGAAAGPAGALVASLAPIPLFALYFILMHASESGATLGKRAFGIRVSDANGERIGYGRSTGRYFATWLSMLTLNIGFLMAAFTGRKQALHDMIAGTLVVRADASPETVAAGTGTMKISGGVIACGLFLALVPMVGIVAAVSIPAYQDYTIRAKMTDSVSAGLAATRDVSEFAAKNGRLPATLEEAHRPAPGPNVTSVTGRFGETAVIRVTPAMAAAKGGAVLFTARRTSEGYQWTCTPDGIPPKFLPQSCRG